MLVLSDSPEYPCELTGVRGVSSSFSFAALVTGGVIRGFSLRLCHMKSRPCFFPSTSSCPKVMVGSGRVMSASGSSGYEGRVCLGFVGVFLTSIGMLAGGVFG